MKNNPHKQIAKTLESAGINRSTIVQHVNAQFHDASTQKDKTFNSASEIFKHCEKLYSPIQYEYIMETSVFGNYPRAAFLDQKTPEQTKPDNQEAEEPTKPPRIPELKNQYKIILVEIVQGIQKKCGYPIKKIGDKFRIYNGKYFLPINADEELTDFLMEIGEKTGIPRFIMHNADFVRKVVEQLALHTAMTRNKKISDKILINLQNGILEIKKGLAALIPHDPKYVLTYLLSFNYDPDAQSPVWDKHVTKVLQDNTARQLMAEHFANSLIGSNFLKLEKVMVLYGEGANGKSVIHDVITMLLGHENTTHYGLDSLCDNTGYYRSMIENKLLNYSSEMSSKVLSDQFKKLASGEPIDVRNVYEKPRMMTQYAKLVFNCNELPPIVEHSLAYFRRLDIIRFDVIIPVEEQDKELAQKIISSELSGVFNWLLAGLDRLVTQRRFTYCAAVAEQVSQYERSSDNIRLFIDDKGYRKSNDERMAIETLYREYNGYCHSFGHKACSKEMLAKRLRKQGFDFSRSNSGSLIHITTTGMSANDI